MTTRIDPSTDFEHPIIDSAWDYEVIGLRLEKEPIEEAEPFLDLRRGSDRIRVTDMEASQGSIRFFARAVEELSRGAG